MQRFWESKTYVLSCLLAAGCLMLAACQTRTKSEDMNFGRATQQRLAKGFEQQIAELSQAEKTLPSTAEAPKMPANFSPWWTEPVCTKIFDNSRPAAYTLENLYVRALEHSSQIRVFSDIPLIRETGIQEAQGEFDTHLFAETAYEHTNEPVTTLLKTGNNDPRYKQWEARAKVGVRKKLMTGAEVELSEEFRRTTNNSAYFDPHRQSTATLALTINQPLLRGAGSQYNRARIHIAEIDSEIARNEFIRQAEGHLLEINRAYWNLYFARAKLLQTQKLVKDTAEIVKKIGDRKDIDKNANDSDLARADAALSKRRADLVRSGVAVKNAEDRIKALLNDPTLLPTNNGELLPANAPVIRPAKIDMKEAAATALKNRPEITQAFLQIKAAAVRKKVSKNELLPQLDLILASSLMGMDKAGCMTDGFDNQFHGAHPGFLVGLKFDYPCPNNTAKAVYLRRRLEIRQLMSDLQTTVDTVLLEVKIAAREVMTAYREMASRYEALEAAKKDVETLNTRWTKGLSAGESASGYLQLLVDAQDRLAAAESDFTQSAVVYNVAAIALQRAQGTLLKYEDLDIQKGKDDAGLPTLNIAKKEKPHYAPTGPVPAAKPITPVKPVKRTTPDNTAEAKPAAPEKVSARPMAKPVDKSPAVKASATSGSPYQGMTVSPAKPSSVEQGKPAATTPEKREAARSVIKKAMSVSFVPQTSDQPAETVASRER